MADISYWHEFPSNFSGGQSVTGLGSFFQYNNFLVDGGLGAFILFATFSISFLSLRAFSFEKAFASASFITFIIAILLMRINMIAVHWAVMIGVALVVSVLLARNSAEKGL